MYMDSNDLLTLDNNGGCIGRSSWCNEDTRRIRVHINITTICSVVHTVIQREENKGGSEGRQVFRLWGEVRRDSVGGVEFSHIGDPGEVHCHTDVINMSENDSAGKVTSCPRHHENRWIHWLNYNCRWGDWTKNTGDSEYMCTSTHALVHIIIIVPINYVHQMLYM